MPHRELQDQPGAQPQEEGREASVKTETEFSPFCFNTKAHILETKLINTAQSSQLLSALDTQCTLKDPNPWMESTSGETGEPDRKVEHPCSGSTMMISLTKILCSSFDLARGKKQLRKQKNL